MIFTSQAFIDANPGAAEISEVDPSPTENHGFSAFSASVKLKVPWDLRFALTDDIVGAQLQYPRTFQNNPSSNVIAQSASIVPFSKLTGSDVQALVHETALVTINYASAGTGGGGGTLGSFTESITPSGEFQTLNPDPFYWVPPDSEGSTEEELDGIGLNKDEAPGMLIIGFDYSATTYRLPSLPNSILTAISKVNASEFTAPSLGITFPPETLLFTGSTSNRKVQAGGESLWTNTSTFSYRQNTWNKFFRAETGTWDTIKLKDGTVVKPFPTDGFAGLIPGA